MPIVRMPSDGYVVQTLHRAMSESVKTGRDVSFWLPETYLKIKVGGGMWTPNLFTFYNSVSPVTEQAVIEGVVDFAKS